MIRRPHPPPSALSTEDGPGLRTTVFFKGCPLRSAWCHNPESLSPSPQVQWPENRCIDCGTCVPACPEGCLVRAAPGLVIDRERCLGCGLCAEACPAGAMELLGSYIGLEKLVTEVMKDRAYFDASGGGVTVSGGEPTPGRLCGCLHAEDTGGGRAHGAGYLRPLPALRPGTDPAAHGSRALRPQGDRWAAASHAHRRGVPADPGQSAARPGLQRHPIAGAGPRNRTPLIPGATATPDNIAGIGRYLAENLDSAATCWQLARSTTCAGTNMDVWG